MAASPVERPSGKTYAHHPSKAALEVAFQTVRKARVPQIPDVVLALRKELGRPEPDIRAASELIAQDLAIAGQLLKTINSPAFQLRSKITSIPQAVSMVGIKHLANLVTAEAVNRLFQATEGQVRVVWEAIMQEAKLMVAVARTTQQVSEDEAYLFGIMHDVGSLIFAMRSPDYGTAWVLHSHSDPGALLEYEQAHLGVDHSVVGYLLARVWQLPEHLALAIYHHHTLGHLGRADPAAARLIAISKLARYLIALSHGTHEMSEMIVYREDAWRELDIGEDDWSDLCAHVQAGSGWH